MRPSFAKLRDVRTDPPNYREHITKGAVASGLKTVC